MNAATAIFHAVADLLLGYIQPDGNANRATLAVARKLVAYLMAVDRGQTHFLVIHGETRTAANSVLPRSSKQVIDCRSDMPHNQPALIPGFGPVPRAF